MNRAPGKGDSWWAGHVEACGGSFTKIAGRQKNKIDGWVSGQKRPASVEGRSADADDGEDEGKKKRMTVACPICEEAVAHDRINQHLDDIHTL
jgi:endogenous inhibitor of DNA gyrase (YacG/DUF329 family)